MTRISNFILTILAFSILTGGCDRPECNNTNPVFDKYSPVFGEYKTELAKQLGMADNSKLTYWFNQYTESNGQEQLFFNIQGEGICAVLVLDVEEWGKLEKLRQKKGLSFKGAEFTNLKFDIKQDSSQTKFIYRDFDKIID